MAFFIFPKNIISQEKDEIFSELIAKNDSLDVQIIKKGNSKKINYYIFFNNKLDSIPFRFLSGNFKSTMREYVDTCIISAIQLDKTGRKEIVIEFESLSRTMDQKSISTEIFNLDSKQRIFHGKNLWYSMYEGERLTECLGYSYSISFDYNGNLIIKYPYPHFCMAADQKEGIYSLQNGIYSFVE